MSDGKLYLYTEQGSLLRIVTQEDVLWEGEIEKTEVIDQYSDGTPVTVPVRIDRYKLFSLDEGRWFWGRADHCPQGRKVFSGTVKTGPEVCEVFREEWISLPKVIAELRDQAEDPERGGSIPHYSSDWDHLIFSVPVYKPRRQACDAPLFFLCPDRAKQIHSWHCCRLFMTCDGVLVCTEPPGGSGTLGFLVSPHEAIDRLQMSPVEAGQLHGWLNLAEKKAGGGKASAASPLQVAPPSNLSSADNEKKLSRQPEGERWPSCPDARDMIVILRQHGGYPDGQSQVAFVQEKLEVDKKRAGSIVRTMSRYGHLWRGSDKESRESGQAKKNG